MRPNQRCIRLNVLYEILSQPIRGLFRPLMITNGIMLTTARVPERLRRCSSLVIMGPFHSIPWAQRMTFMVMIDTSSKLWNRVGRIPASTGPIRICF